MKVHINSLSVNKLRINVGPIVGGVLGVILALILILIRMGVVVIIMRCRNNQREAYHQGKIMHLNSIHLPVRSSKWVTVTTIQCCYPPPPTEVLGYHNYTECG